MSLSCFTILQKMSHDVQQRLEQSKHQSVSEGDCCGRHFLKQKTSSVLSITARSIGTAAKIILPCGLCKHEQSSVDPSCSTSETHETANSQNLFVSKTQKKKKEKKKNMKKR